MVRRSFTLFEHGSHTSQGDPHDFWQIADSFSLVELFGEDQHESTLSSLTFWFGFFHIIPPDLLPTSKGGSDTQTLVDGTLQGKSPPTTTDVPTTICHSKDATTGKLHIECLELPN